MTYDLKELNSSINELTEKKLQKHHKRSVLILKVCLLIAAGTLIGITAAAVGFARAAIAEAPSLDILNSASYGYSSKIYDSDGHLIETLTADSASENEVSYEDIPQNLTNAIVCVEDSRFWQHNGVDVKAILRAAYVGITTGRLSSDSSTITEQLIENNVLDTAYEAGIKDSLKRMIQEQHLAIQLEKKLDKNIILEYYLNTLYFGNDCIGAASAARTFFGKNISSLTLSECAVLTAAAINPSAYDPISHADDNREMCKTVLEKMLEQNYISDVEMEEALKDDVYTRIQTANGRVSVSDTYSCFTAEVCDQVVSNLQTELGCTSSQAYKLLRSGGLQIYTTMDEGIQSVLDEEINNSDNYLSSSGEKLEEYSLNYSLTIKHENGSFSAYNENNITAYFQSEKNQATFRNIFSSEEAISSAIDEFKDYVMSSGDEIESETVIVVLEPQASAIVIDQSNGHVLAISGGRAANDSALTVNRAADSLREPGSVLSILSTFAPALDTFGASLASVYYDAPYSIGDQQILDWWGTQYLGYNNIRQAITYSMNVISAKCLTGLVSYQTACDYLTAWGITSLSASDRTALLSAGNLTNGITNEQLTCAYAAIANDGIYNEPVYYTRVLDRHGNVLLETESKGTRVIKISTAALLTSAMEDVISSDSNLYYQYGITPTGRPCVVDGIELAGKSGSSVSGYDRWFIGYSPYYTVGIWTGYDDTKALGAGTDYYKVIWQHIMSRIHDSLEDKTFAFSDELETALICSKSGLLAVDGVCNASGSDVVYEESFARGTAPTEYCDRHYTLRICNVSGKSATEYCPDDEVTQKIYLKIDDSDLTSGTTIDTSLLAPSNLQSCDIHTAETE